MPVKPVAWCGGVGGGGERFGCGSLRAAWGDGGRGLGACKIKSAGLSEEIANRQWS